MKVCVIVGGAGYIGTKLCERFVALSLFEKIIVTDIRDPKYRVDGVEYLIQDVREGISLILPEGFDGAESWLFNLAAVHREPGHDAYEYFDTNIQGALNVNEFLINSGIKNLYFTSSIAPYGRSREMRDENSACYPETPYGISKWKAESIHEVWLRSEEGRRLIICRPSVIYGPGDPGNVLRMIRGIKKGTFFIPGDPTIIKSHGYIYGLIDSVLFTMQKTDGFILYNYAENPCLSLGEMVAATKKVLGIKRTVLRVPLSILIILARIITLFYPQSPIHPVRVKKAAFPTNIRPQYLIDNGFEFKYAFPQSLQHWLKQSPQDFE
jgi:nucleoside-diphosphate-sugar epimerase